MSAEELPEESSAPTGAPAWMATFGDMMSLLLCFFVLLLSFANMDIIKFRDMMGSMKDAFGVKVESPGEFEGRTTTLIEISEHEKQRDAPVELMPQPTQPAEENRDDELLRNVELFIVARGLEETVEALAGDPGVRVRAKGALIFEVASDTLRPEATEIFDEIARLAESFDYNVVVEGHTDDQPIRTERFPSNWELSTARAVAGVRYLIDQGHIEAERLSATGMAHTRPIAPNDTAEQRSENRRLEFVFNRDDGPSEREVRVFE